ncbi:MAG: hypothetical protein ACRDNF_25190 [Streptosporangiaceae bacterium]
MGVGGLIAGIVMVLAAVTFGPRLCAKVWRDPGYADVMTRSGRVLPFGYNTSRGVTRGMLGLWTGLGFIGAGTIAVAFLPAGTTHRASPALIAGVVLYGIGILGIGLNAWIIWFNRPRALVPPHMRDEEGMVTAWWRSRDLPPAQRKAAARARRRWPALDRAAASARSGRTR